MSGIGHTVRLLTPLNTSTAFGRDRSSVASRIQGTKTGGGPISDLPIGLGRPKLSLTLNLNTCKFVVATGATILVRTTAQGSSTDAVEVAAQVQFAGEVLSTWRILGLSELEITPIPSALAWGAMNLDKNTVMPLGHAAQLFNPINRSVGVASSSYAITPVP